MRLHSHGTISCAALALSLALVSAAAPQAITASPDREGRSAAPAADINGVIAPSAATGLVDPDAYIVGPGDLFGLNLSGRVTSAQLLRVSPEGSMFIPGLAAVRLTGLTLGQARREVLRQLEKELRGVQIDFQLVQVRLITVRLAGDVKAASAVQLLATSRVSDAVQSDSLMPGASRRRIEVRRRDGSRLFSDLTLFSRSGRDALSPFLRDGDIVYVPTATEFIEIYGAVAHPGQYELGAGDSLGTLFDLAGGILPSARRDRALLVRWKTPTLAESLWFDVDSLRTGATNPVLRNGDRAYIYFIAGFHELEQVLIDGEVERPGVYPIVSGKFRLSDLIRAAGGFGPRADLSKIRVHRSPPYKMLGDDPELARLTRLSRTEMTSGEYYALRTRLQASREDFRVDWNRIRSSPELDLLMQAGDSVVVDPVMASVRVEGEVRRPGMVDFRPDLKASGYVGLAGGFSDRAAARKLMVMRAVTGQTLPANDVPSIAPGDMIWVPERSDRTLWDHSLTLLTVAAQVATLIFVFRKR